MQQRFTRSRTVGAVAAVAIALTLAGCTGGGASPGGSSASSSGGGGAGVAAAKAVVDKYSKVDTTFTAPGDPIKDVSSLSGKQVMYIPANGVVPYFAVSYNGIKSALSSVGVKTTECDAKANPSDTASCLNQAVSEKDAAVVIDSLPPVIAQQAFEAVENAGIPVLLLSQSVPDGSKSTVQATGQSYVQLLQIAADVITADSNGKATTLGVGVNDSPITVAWLTQGAAPEFKKNCPGCAFSTVYTKTTDLQQLPSLVSAALLKSPSTNYLLPEFGAVLDGSIQGAQNASRTDVKVVSTTGGLDDMQRLKAGTELADVGFDLTAQGWYASDTLIRLMLKLPVDTAKSAAVFVPRVFTKASVQSLDISSAGQANSSWYGGTGYQDKLKALWGVN
jgi:ribose transport system substrate-binding protein